MNTVHNFISGFFVIFHYHQRYDKISADREKELKINTILRILSIQMIVSFIQNDGMNFVSGVACRDI